MSTVSIDPDATRGVADGLRSAARAIGQGSGGHGVPGDVPMPLSGRIDGLLRAEGDLSSVMQGIAENLASRTDDVAEAAEAADRA